MRDNGSGKLALILFALSDTITFTGTDTYSGGTALEDGTLALSQNGSILNSAVTTWIGGTLQLDNSSGVLANRISDTADLTMKGGQVKFIGNSATAVEEVAGNLKFYSAVTIDNNQPGAAAALLTFSAATRMNHATINFTGSGRTKWVGMANDAGGIVGAYATAGNGMGHRGRRWPGGCADDLRHEYQYRRLDRSCEIHGGRARRLWRPPAKGRRSIFKTAVAPPGTLDVGTGQTLTLGEGGILSSGSAAGQVQNGTLQAGATGELVVTNQNTFTISSNIGESMAGTGLTKSGAGKLTLSGTNSYSGVTAINQGTLVVSSDANLGTGSTVEFAGGTLQAAQSFSSTKSFTNPIPQTGVVDTSSFNLTFGGVSSGAISKIGTGTLTLTNPAPGSVFIQQGHGPPIQSHVRQMDLQGGTLLTAGNSVFAFGRLQFHPRRWGLPRRHPDYPSSFSSTSSSPLTVRFGLGLSASDLWNIGSANGFSPGSSTAIFLFDFQNLGGATAGQNYTLMNVQVRWRFVVLYPCLPLHRRR